MKIVQCLLLATIHSSFQPQELLPTAINVRYSIDLLCQAKILSYSSSKKDNSSRSFAALIRSNFAGSSGSGACLSTNLYPVFVPNFERCFRWFSLRDFQGDINAKYIKATLDQFPTCCTGARYHCY